MDLTDIFRAFHPKAAEYTFFSSVHGTFSRIDHMYGHKTSLYKLKKTEIISSIFPDHNYMKLEINHKKKLKNTQIHGGYMLPDNEWFNNEIKDEIKRYPETNENENTTTPNL